MELVYVDSLLNLQMGSGQVVAGSFASGNGCVFGNGVLTVGNSTGPWLFPVLWVSRMRVFGGHRPGAANRHRRIKRQRDAVYWRPSNQRRHQDDDLSATITNSLIIGDTTSAGFTITLPAASTSTGQTLEIVKKAAANTLTIAGHGTDNINVMGFASANTVTLTQQYSSLMLTCDGSVWWATATDGLVGPVVMHEPDYRSYGCFRCCLRDSDY